METHVLSFVYTRAEIESESLLLYSCHEIRFIIGIIIVVKSGHCHLNTTFSCSARLVTRMPDKTLMNSDLLV